MPRLNNAATVFAGLVFMAFAGPAQAGARGVKRDAATGAFRPTWDARKQTLTFDYKPLQTAGAGSMRRRS